MFTADVEEESNGGRIDNIFRIGLIGLGLSKTSQLMQSLDLPASKCLFIICEQPEYNAPQWQMSNNVEPHHMRQIFGHFERTIYRHSSNRTDATDYQAKNDNRAPQSDLNSSWPILLPRMASGTKRYSRLCGSRCVIRIWEKIHK